MKRSKPLSRRAPRVNAIIHRGRPYQGIHDEPRPLDPIVRRQRHGPVLPMEQPGFFARLFGRG